MIGRPVPGADGEPIFITAHADTYDVPADLAVGDAIEVRYPVPNLTTITKAAHAAEETS
jgi:hypothetical protein